MLAIVDQGQRSFIEIRHEKLARRRDLPKSTDRSVFLLGLGQRDVAAAIREGWAL
jgi:hypothetical protein